MVKVVKLGKIQSPGFVTGACVGTCKYCGCQIAVTPDDQKLMRDERFPCPTLLCQHTIQVEEGIIA